MKAVQMKMDASEHCPECGALLIRDGGVSICAACGYYSFEIKKVHHKAGKKTVLF